MIKKVIVFWGSKRDFEEVISSNIYENENTVTFLELIQIYNARLRPNESGVREDALSKRVTANNCIVRSDDYGSVMPHVLSNFANVMSLNYDIGTLFIQNPPKTVLQSITSRSSIDIEYRSSIYEAFNRDKLKKIYIDLNNNIQSQDECKKQIISNLYRLTKNPSDKPSVVLFYGPSGVGKTESAKSISKSLGGELLRIQFSMMQTKEAYDYVFGAEHSKNSLARDFLSRETNIILIDEFDKVNPTFYNAFYELFDEGVFSDVNYEVEMKQAIFVLTSNFKNEDEIKKVLGPAMYSRVGACIEFKDIGIKSKKVIIEKWYNEITNNLDSEEKDVIEKSPILQWFMDNASRYDNIRILKSKMETAIFEKLSKVFIISDAAK